MEICNFCFLEFSLRVSVWAGRMAQEVAMPASTPEDLSPFLMTHVVAEQTWVLEVVICLPHTCGMCPTHTSTQKAINKNMWKKRERKNSGFFPDSKLFVTILWTFINHLVFPKFRHVCWDRFSLTPKSWECPCFSEDPYQCTEELLALNTKFSHGLHQSLERKVWTQR